MFLGMGSTAPRVIPAAGEEQGWELEQLNSDRGAQSFLFNLNKEDPLEALASGKYSLARHNPNPLIQPEGPPLHEVPLHSPVPSSSVCLSPLLFDPYSRDPNLSHDSGSVFGNTDVVTGNARLDQTGPVRPGQPTSIGLPGKRQRRALVLARRLKTSLGDKFADTFREKVQEVMKQESESGNEGAGSVLWSGLEHTTSLSSPEFSREDAAVTGPGWPYWNESSSEAASSSPRVQDALCRSSSLSSSSDEPVREHVKDVAPQSGTRVGRDSILQSRS